MEDRRLFLYERPRLTTEEKIVDAAVAVYARHGIARTPLHAVAQAAGVSVGAVQHHFSTKGELTEAVNHRVLEIIAESMGLNEQSVDVPAVRAGDGLIQLMAEYPTAMDYLRRVFVGDNADEEVGRMIFDGLAKLSQAQGITFMAEGKLLDDVDFLWAFLNPLILRLGAILLREHVERFLTGPFYNKEQLTRWDASIQFLLERGYNNAIGPDHVAATSEVSPS